MPKYRITDTTVYIIEAENEDAALDIYYKESPTNLWSQEHVDMATGGVETEELDGEE